MQTGEGRKPSYKERRSASPARTARLAASHAAHPKQGGGYGGLSFHSTAAARLAARCSCSERNAFQPQPPSQSRLHVA